MLRFQMVLVITLKNQLVMWWASVRLLRILRLCQFLGSFPMPLRAHGNYAQDKNRCEPIMKYCLLIPQFRTQWHLDSKWYLRRCWSPWYSECISQKKTTEPILYHPSSHLVCKFSSWLPNSDACTKIKILEASCWIMTRSCLLTD